MGYLETLTDEELFFLLLDALEMQDLRRYNRIKAEMQKRMRDE